MNKLGNLVGSDRLDPLMGFDALFKISGESFVTTQEVGSLRVITEAFVESEVDAIFYPLEFSVADRLIGEFLKLT